jgi:RNA-directed DNA polymerase
MRHEKSGYRQGLKYKAACRSPEPVASEVGGGHSTVERQDSRTWREGRTPALTGVAAAEEGLVTAQGISPWAQRTHRKVQVLQQKLHQAAKKDLRRTFGILYDKVCWWEVLWTSWIRVQQNQGAPGVDGRTIRAIKADGEVQFLQNLQQELTAKRYKPQPIRQVFIKKANGKLRPLGIPTVRDRVVQGAVKLILEPIFETNFMPESYGFRPRRSCQDALKAVRKWVMAGYSTVIDADLEAYFDTIDHTVLLSLVQRRVRDKWVLRLIRGWLECAIFEHDKTVLAERGTGQGSVLSPLLANIYLHPLDKYWAERFPETKLIRYCDDFVILTRRKAPERYLQQLKTFLSRLRLTLSTEKTQVITAEEGFDFLGARLVLKPTRRSRNRKFCYGFPSPKAMKSVRQHLRTAMGQDHTKALAEIIGYLTPVLRGWANYYNWLNSADHFHEVERYVIQRLNRWRRRKQQRVRRSYRKLSGPELYQHGLYKITGRIAHVS